MSFIVGNASCSDWKKLLLHSFWASTHLLAQMVYYHTFL